MSAVPLWLCVSVSRVYLSVFNLSGPRETINNSNRRRATKARHCHTSIHADARTVPHAHTHTRRRDVKMPRLMCAALLVTGWNVQLSSVPFDSICCYLPRLLFSSSVFVCRSIHFILLHIAPQSRTISVNTFKDDVRSGEHENIFGNDWRGVRLFAFAQHSYVTLSCYLLPIGWGHLWGCC